MVLLELHRSCVVPVNRNRLCLCINDLLSRCKWAKICKSVIRWFLSYIRCNSSNTIRTILPKSCLVILLIGPFYHFLQQSTSGIIFYLPTMEMTKILYHYITILMFEFWYLILDVDFWHPIMGIRGRQGMKRFKSI